MSADWIAPLNDAAGPWAAAMGRACWQGGVALAVAGALCLAWPRMPGRARCWLWRLAYLKLFIALFWATPVDLPLLHAAAVPPVRAADEAPASTTPSLAVLRRHDRQPTPVFPSAARSPQPRASCGLLLLWLLGAGACLARVAREWREAQRLRRASELVREERLTACYAALCRRFEVRQAPLLLTGEAAGTPMLMGVRRPAVILSASLVGQCTLAELELMLAHELAHLKRRDLLWAWLATAARAGFFFHPLVWLADREWRLAQEMACDEMAVRVTKSPAADYGDVLLKLAAQRPTRAHGGQVTVGALESPQMLRRRLIGMRSIRASSRRQWVVGGAMLGVLGLLTLVPWRVTAQAAPAAPAKVPWPAFYYFDRPGERMGPDLERLHRPYVLQELKVTGQQRARIHAVMAALRREQAQSRPPWTELSPAQREAEWEKIRRMVKRAHEQVAAILTPGQMQRLRQIHLQYNGAFALQEDDIAAELELTPEQRQQVRRIYEEHMKAVRVPSSQLQDPKAERAYTRRFRQVYQRNQRRILAVLTVEQRNHFLQMLGRPLPNLEETLLFRLRRR